MCFGGPAALLLAGEWFAGGKIEGAWLSGVAAGEMLLSRFVPGAGRSPHFRLQHRVKLTAHTKRHHLGLRLLAHDRMLLGAA